jgi:hypothetical protein
MHGRAHEHLDCFQLDMARLADASEDGAQQLSYFARNFLLDSFRGFFSSDESVSSTGRARQI